MCRTTIVIRVAASVTVIVLAAVTGCRNQSTRAYCAVAAVGRTYYVSPDGADGGAGAEASPISLRRANESVAPGDTVILADGEYPMPIAPARSGQPGKPITYRAANRHKAMFVDGPIEAGLDPVHDAAVELPDRSHIIIDGIAGRQLHRWIFATGSSHITIRNCSFADSTGWESVRFRNTGDRIVIINNRFVNGTDSVTIGPGNGHLIADNSFEVVRPDVSIALGSAEGPRGH